MSRAIPGFGEHEEGREFIYVEASNAEDFRQVMDGAFASRRDVPLPQSGAALEEKARINLADGTSLLAMSYRGDVEGWRRTIVSFCERNRKKWAFPGNEALVMSDGTEVSLQDCDVVFEA